MYSLREGFNNLFYKVLWNFPYGGGGRSTRNPLLFSEEINVFFQDKGLARGVFISDFNPNG